MKKIGIITIIILLIIAIIIGTYIIFLLRGPKEKNKNKPVYVYNTGGDFLTNLKNRARYVKTNILIGVFNKSTIRVMERNSYIIRDQIIEILGEIEEEDIEEPKFKENLRNKIKKDLQNRLNIDKIEGVYFNDFIIH